MGFIMIAPFITREEYQCRCCGGLPPDVGHTFPMAHEMLFESFEIIREAYGRPIYISSGYRCPLHNTFVGGKYLSTHLWGLALDLKTGQDTDHVYRIIDRELPDLRVGKYSNFLHMDVGYLIHPRATEAWEKGKRWN
jgi:hypothetical protein